MTASRAGSTRVRSRPTRSSKCANNRRWRLEPRVASNRRPVGVVADQIAGLDHHDAAVLPLPRERVEVRVVVSFDAERRRGIARQQLRVDLSAGNDAVLIGEREPDGSHVARHIGHRRAIRVPDHRSANTGTGERRRERADLGVVVQRGVPHGDRRLGETHDAAPCDRRHGYTRAGRAIASRAVPSSNGSLLPRHSPSSSGRPSAAGTGADGDVPVAERRPAVHAAAPTGRRDHCVRAAPPSSGDAAG